MERNAEPLRDQHPSSPRWQKEFNNPIMGKRKLTPLEKAEKKRRRELYETVFIGGKQKRVKRKQTIDGMDVDEFIERNADPIWLHQNEMWELMEPIVEPENEDLCKNEDPF